MNLLKQYVSINNILIDIQQNEQNKNEQLKQCDAYYQTILNNENCVQKFPTIYSELMHQFECQKYDLPVLSSSFSQLYQIDELIKQIKNYMIDNKTFLRRFFREHPNYQVLSGNNCYEMVSLATIEQTIDSLENLRSMLSSAVYQEKKRRENTQNNWKTVALVIGKIIKYTFMVVGAVFVVIYYIVKLFSSSRDDD